MARSPSPIEPANSIKQFCEIEGISASHYFALRARGEGPAETRIGRRVIITPESHRRWRKRHTAPARRRDQSHDSANQEAS